MVRKKTEIIIDEVAYPVIKELDHNYIIVYDGEKRLFNKKRKKLVYAGYDMKKRKEKAKVRTTRGSNGNYNREEHEKLVLRFTKVREKLSEYNFNELSLNIGISFMTLSNFLKMKRVNENTLRLIGEWITKNE